jgi:hypothetical protein
MVYWTLLMFLHADGAFLPKYLLEQRILQGGLVRESETYLLAKMNFEVKMKDQMLQNCYHMCTFHNLLVSD